MVADRTASKQHERGYGRRGVSWATRATLGSYRVSSTSPTTSNPEEKLLFDLMVRCDDGYSGAPIGSHTIPRTYAGVPIQSESALGASVGVGGCVRQRKVDAVWLYHGVHVGDTVVVLH